MPIPVAEKRAAFRALHAQGCFVLPNPWDIGGARRLEKLGFKALASTSAGLAWSLGRDDNALPRDAVLEHLRGLCAATGLPVNADFEDGFAADPDGVAANVALAVATGVAGLSIEDRDGRGLHSPGHATERIRAARAAIDASGEDVMLVARSEGFLLGQPDLDATIARLVAYADAGADVLYAPGVADAAAIARIVRAVAPKPVNVLLMHPRMRVADLAALGVRRVSTGGALAAAAWRGFDLAARQLVETGTLPPRA
ncbi:isocitrate lyase/phosphoenolpyruvate mutase family protein [Rudaea sp.]|uniref:isocitrate lyase/PEP mutase family protein n=1 Tax=Rudaea sp. TaxID=2136325 RepID=UPI00321F6F1B